MSHHDASGPVSLTIDGRPVTVDAETTILHAARKVGVTIPAFCDDDRMRPYGACRMCLVQVEGKKRIFPACTTPVEKNMKIITNSPEIQRLRQTSLELLLLHHPLECPICDAAGECQLQDYAFAIGRPANRFTAARRNEPIDKRAPLIEIDNNRCILCGKCVRICDEVQGVHALDFAGRGLKTRVTPAFNRPLDCEFCGQCVSVCPVGALTPKVQKYKARVWQLKNTRTVCNFCGTGCTIELRTLGQAVHRAWAPLGAGVNQGNLCGKGRFGFEFVQSPDRLKTPLIRKNGVLTEATWDEALSHAAKRLLEIKNKNGGKAIAALGSPRGTNEDAFVLRRLLHEALESKNLDSCGRFGQAVLEEALQKSFGTRRVSQSPGKFRHADLILVVETDLSDFNPVFSLDLLKAKFSEQSKVITANAKHSKVVRHSDLSLKLRPASAVSLLNALSAALLSKATAEVRAIKGFEAFAKSLDGCTIDKAARETGLSVADLKAAVDLFAHSKAPVITLALGMHENTKNLQTLLSAANLSILLGQGSDGLAVPAEFCNLQGLSDMGVTPEAGQGWNDWPSAGIKALLAVGDDPMALYPDRGRTESFLKSLDLLVVQDLFLTDTAKMAEVVLPSASFAEKEGTVTNSDLWVQRIRRAFEPAGKSMSDWHILTLLASKLGKSFGYADAGMVTADIGKTVPAYAGAAEFTEALVPVGDCPSASGFAFNVARPEILGTVPGGPFPLRLFFGNLQHHSGGLALRCPGLLSAEGHSELVIHPADAAKASLATGDRVRIIGEKGEARSQIKVDGRILEGYVYTSAHFTDDRMNSLMPAVPQGPVPVRLERILNAV